MLIDISSINKAFIIIIIIIDSQIVILRQFFFVHKKNVHFL